MFEIKRVDNIDATASAAAIWGCTTVSTVTVLAGLKLLAVVVVC